MNTSFVHLHVHTEYSLLDGAARIDALVEEARRLGMPALAITDHGAMYGVVPFYEACRSAGIKPIIGCECYLTDGDLHERPSPREHRMYHLLLIAKNNEGYRNLMKLSTIAHLEGFHYKPRIDKRVLRELSEGLIATSSCLAGEIPQAILQDRYSNARRLAREYLEIFGEGHFFLELQDHRMPEQQKVNRFLIELSRETGIPLIATNDVHYLRQEDHGVHDCLLCIGTGRRLADEDRMRFPSDQFYLKSAEEMGRLFAHVPEALANTVRIAEQCHVEIPLGQRLLPRFPVPDGETAASYLRKLCERGLQKRYGTPTAEAKRRLDYELSVIERMGFSDYFLIVWDFVRFAREQGIMTGPGRGSAAGSLVSYVLRITDIDPIRYGLLFERFLNPERVSMPDIDIDFDYERRDEVIAYVTRKYGADRVAQIITFGTMAPRAAVRDVGRVMGLPYADVDRAAKLIPAAPGMTLEKAFAAEPRLQQLCNDHPRIAELMKVVRKVEGLPRHASTHAAGVVIADQPLTAHTPLQEGHDGGRLTQYPMEVLERIGLLKADFLGLRNLTVIGRAIELIRQHHGKAIDFSRMSYDDPQTYALLSRGETTGVFQLESAGMRKVLRELKPSHFEDLIAVLALYRPGPMDQIPRFIRAKHGLEKVKYPHPDLEPILRDTYGIIVYQEQIMQIAAKMAGFTLGQADLLRRAVSKKNRALLDEQRTAFVKGCVANGYDEETGEKVYDLIVRFADYGFNRSHSAAYAVLAYQTAYLKAHYPLEYMAALLTTVMGSHGKMAEYIEECRRMGIDVRLPDVNRSAAAFSVEDGAIRFGLAAVKHVGKGAIRALIREREKRPFRDLFDLCARVDLRVCNRRVLEALIQCGAMDAFPGHRAQWLAMLDEAMEYGTSVQKSRSDDQLGLFGDEEPEEPRTRFSYDNVTPFSQKEKLELERELLGLYVSGHPLQPFRRVIEAYATHAVAQLDECRESEAVTVAGVITEVKPITTKRGEAMAFAQIEEGGVQVEVVLFPRVLERYRASVRLDRPVLVTGRVNHHENGVKILADKVEELEALAKRLDVEKQMDDRRAYVRIPADREEKSRLEALKRVLLTHRGVVPVYLYYERTRKVLALPTDKFGIEPTGECRAQIEAILGKHAFQIVRRSGTSSHSGA